MLSTRIPTLAGLEMLRVVARTGSLNTAARECGVSQQALSARVRTMESHIGVPLLSRSPRGTELTEHGALVVEWATKVLDAAAHLDVGLSALRADRGAHLRIAASLTVAEHLLPGWLVGLHARQDRAGLDVSRVELETTNSDTVAARVGSGSVDVGFVEGPYAPAGLRSRVVAEDRLLLVVPPTHAWARRRTPLRAGEIAAAPLVSRESGSGTRQALERALAGQLPPGTRLAPPALELSNAAAIRSAVVAGAGPGALSSLAVADDLALGRLVVVDATDLPVRRKIRAVWRGGATPPAGPVRELVAIASAARPIPGQ